MDRLERWKELPTIEEWIDKLRTQKYESTERINPYHVLIHQLEDFQKDRSFTRARDLWLRFYLYCELPPVEVELAFVGRIVSDAQTWKTPKNIDTDLGLLGSEMKKGELQRFDERKVEVHKKLCEQGLPAWDGNVYDQIALERFECDGGKLKAGGTIAKEHQRLKKLVENMN